MRPHPFLMQKVAISKCDSNFSHRICILLYASLAYIMKRVRDEIQSRLTPLSILATCSTPFSRID